MPGALGLISGWYRYHSHMQTAIQAIPTPMIVISCAVVFVFLSVIAIPIEEEINPCKAKNNNIAVFFITFYFEKISIINVAIIMPAQIDK
jgi:uncharacterized membrane protein YGL010W